MQNRPELACLAAFAGVFALLGAAPAGGSGSPWTALERPLRMKTLAPGARCPVTPAHHLTAGVPDGVGAGPAYPMPFTFSKDDRHPAWLASKTVWAWKPALKTRSTRVLVRGRRIDRPGVVKFQLGPQWDSTPLEPDLHIDTTRTVGSFGNSPWGTTVTLEFVRAPGCYALQLDTAGGTRTIVLEAKRG
jgi:hypothetical protein